MKLSRDNVLWFAGLYEGEGSMSRVKKSNNWRLSLGMTDEDVIQKIQATFGGSIVIENRDHLKYKMLYRWYMNERKKVYAICAAIYPFLGKRRQAKLEEFFENFANPIPRKTGTKRPWLSVEMKRKWSTGEMRPRNAPRDPLTGKFIG